MSTCLTTDQFELLAAGADEAGAATAEHLEQCPSCRDRLQQYREEQDYLRDVREAWTASRLSMEGTDRHSVTITVDRPDQARHQLDSIPGYEIIREIHRGGQGVVYEAVQQSTRRTVAVKVLLEGPFAGDRARWRFEREVKLVAALKHPNIIIIHDSGIAHGRYFFAMDYVRGQPLDTHIRLSQPPLRSTVQMFRQICDAVAYAHRRGIIHRDLKPSNILVTPEGCPCVLDFGLAKIISEELEEANQAGVTVPGNLMGTLRYMSPEQTLGSGDSIDVRTDVYTLGVILYELLTGEPPYNTSTDLAKALKNIRESDPPRPSRIRPEMNLDLETIILKAMDKEPERRYQSAGELSEDLGAYLDGRPIAARSASSLYVIRKLAVKHSFETLTIASLLLALLGFGGLALRSEYHKRLSAENELRTRQALATTMKDIGDFTQKGQEATEANALGWFLETWRQGDLEAARDIRDRTPGKSPAHSIMSFLLDDIRTPEQLMATLPPGLQPVGQLAIGERHLKRREFERARAAFKAAVLAVDSDVARGWDVNRNRDIRAAAQARLRYMDGLKTREVAP